MQLPRFPPVHNIASDRERVEKRVYVHFPSPLLPACIIHKLPLLRDKDRASERASKQARNREREMVAAPRIDRWRVFASSRSGGIDARVLICTPLYTQELPMGIILYPSSLDFHGGEEKILLDTVYNDGENHQHVRYCVPAASSFFSRN